LHTSISFTNILLALNHVTPFKIKTTAFQKEHAYNAAMSSVRGVAVGTKTLRRDVQDITYSIKTNTILTTLYM